MHAPILLRPKVVCVHSAETATTYSTHQVVNAIRTVHSLNIKRGFEHVVVSDKLYDEEIGLRCCLGEESVNSVGITDSQVFDWEGNWCHDDVAPFSRNVFIGLIQ